MIQHVFAHTLGVPDHNVQIIAPDVGGSFGLKIHTYGDELATAAAAIQLGRPVKFIADRLESFVSDIHARENFVKARIAVSKSGEIQAFDIDVLSGAGAYSQYPRTSVFEATQVLNITGGPYRHKHYRARATVVYLNKPPTSQYRAVGHPIGNAVGEHLVDRAAAALGIDPIEMRRRNVMPDDGYPAITASGIKLKDLSHQRCIDALVERMRLRRAARRAGAAARARASTAASASPASSRARRPGRTATTASAARRSRCRTPASSGSSPTAASSVPVGVTEQGQGTDTVMGQIAAAALGVPMESVRVISGDTDATPYGGGTYGSRAAAIGGEAVYQAARDLRQEILEHRRRAAAGRRLRARHRRRRRGRPRRRRASACRSPRSAASATSSSASCPTACSRCCRTRAASAWSTISTSSPTASTAPMSRSTPTPASSAS